MKEESFTQRLHLDIPLILGLLLTCGLGIVVLYSAAGQDITIVYRQGIRIAIAFLLMMLIAQIHPIRLSRISVWLFVTGIVLLIIVLTKGYVINGAQRWLDVGLFRFQPSELMKLSVPMMLAWYFSEKSLPPTALQIITATAIILLPVLLIAKQPDLGTAILVAAGGISVLFIAGMSLRYLIVFGVLASMFTPVLWFLMHDYQRQRVLSFLNPDQDPLGAGYHIIQSMIAIGSGGLYGKGWLNGTQSHLEFLPESSTDFIFAVLCEEFGFTGVLLLLSLYTFIFLRGIYISINAQQLFGKLLGISLILTFFVYVIVNMGMVTGQLPVVGVPLPLISHGGSSIVTLMVGFGILMAIHTHRHYLSP